MPPVVASLEGYMMMSEAWFLSWRAQQSSEEIKATSGDKAAEDTEPEAQEREMVPGSLFWEVRAKRWERCGDT